MSLLKVLAGVILKKQPDAKCYNCGEEVCELSNEKVVTVFNGNLYCPDCAPIEEIYFGKRSEKRSKWSRLAING